MRINFEAIAYFRNCNICLLKGIFVSILSFSLTGSKKLKGRKGKEVSKAEVMQLICHCKREGNPGHPAKVIFTSDSQCLGFLTRSELIEILVFKRDNWHIGLTLH